MSGMDTNEQLQTIRARVADLERQKARKEADTDLVKSKLRETAASLKTEFGVSSVAEAQELLAKMQAEFSEQLAQVREGLS